VGARGEVGRSRVLKLGFLRRREDKLGELGNLTRWLLVPRSSRFLSFSENSLPEPSIELSDLLVGMPSALALIIEGERGEKDVGSGFRTGLVLPFELELELELELEVEGVVLGDVALGEIFESLEVFLVLPLRRLEGEEGVTSMRGLTTEGAGELEFELKITGGMMGMGE
jgi:hypothetical protein